MKTHLSINKGVATLSFSDGITVAGLKTISSIAKEVTKFMDKINERDLRMIEEKMQQWGSKQLLPVFADDKEREEILDLTVKKMANVIIQNAQHVTEIISLASGHNMPTEIPKKAYLLICHDCEKHARIVGTKSISGNFSDKKHGEDYLKAFLEEDEITPEEAGEIREQLRNWKIPVEPVMN